jgi:uncharacterized protein (TIGR03435 family)
MRSPILPLACLVVAQLCAYGQTTDAQSFEVASVKPASPPVAPIRCSGGPGSSDPGLWRCSNVPVGILIAKAYGFEAYQFRPTDPCCRDRFDVKASVPSGATPEQFRGMMQKLLEDRFQLKFHIEKKNMTVYDLTVAAGGAKLKGAARRSASGAEDPWAFPEYSMGKDGYPVFPATRGGLAGPNGNYRWVGFHVSMQEIAKTLSSQLGAPVIDSTGLQGTYDIDLRWWVDTRWSLERAGLPQNELDELADRGRPGPTLIRAAQEQVGLRLTARKGMGGIVVIDHLQKVPTEN